MSASASRLALVVTLAVFTVLGCLSWFHSVTTLDRMFSGYAITHESIMELTFTFVGGTTAAYTDVTDYQNVAGLITFKGKGANDTEPVDYEVNWANVLTIRKTGALPV